MFAQKYGFWNDYNQQNAPQYEQGSGYPYASETNYNSYGQQNPTTNEAQTISPNGSTNGSTCTNGRSYEHSPDYLKDILEKIADKEKYILGIEKQLVGNIPLRNNTSYPTIDEKEYAQCAYNTSTKDVNNNNTDSNDNNTSAMYSSDKQGEGKKSSILSRFYKADGTPVKSLWDSDAALKEQRAYKYDPKPLERRKNPRSFVPSERKTKEYWDRRKKNNMAARKSREDRRKKEIEVLKVVDNLKNDNLKLKIYAQKVMAENQNLKYELDVLKRL